VLAAKSRFTFFAMRNRFMGSKKPDPIWVLVLLVALGAASSSLLGNDEPSMAPQQAGIIVQ